ncbi:MAG: hypothetical protein ACKVS6_13530, partial [Planctomycetota bacterium]
MKVLSSDIPRFIQHIRQLPALMMFAKEPQYFKIVVDTSFMRGELTFPDNVKQPGAKSAMQELLATGIVQFYAPLKLDREIRK